MLLYNDQYEFIGINEEGLRLLNYGSLDELLHVCSDVADLFANEPGYIHNFKNFKWIDFLLHADSDASSAIVHGKGRTFSCQLHVTPFYLCNTPTSPGYSVEMLHVKNLSGEEFKPQSITPKPTPEPFFTPPITHREEPSAPLPDYTHLTPTQLSEPTVFDIPDIEPSSLDDLIDLVPPPAAAKAAVSHEAPKVGTVHYTPEEQAYLSHLKIDGNYRFDPQVAANELGLPVDLIEEFIGDFIQQAYAFKEDLFTAALKGDFNNLHILSHKLKGVAANLRVEDALETLTIINASTEIGEIEANLKHFYTIIAKLEGKEPLGQSQPTPEVPKTESVQPSLESDDIYAFDLKRHDAEPLKIDETFVLDDVIETYSEPQYEKEFFTPEDDYLLDEKIPEEMLSTIELPQEDDPFTLDDVITPDSHSEILSEESPEEEKAPSVVLHYDVEAMAGTLGIEPAFLHELLDDFKQDARAISESILIAVNAFDTHTWRENASRFIGISDNLRLSEISEEFSIIASTNDAQKAKQASLRLAGYLDQLH